MDSRWDIEAILGGLESALARGQPLQKAMASFYNAGYKKEDIEEAARKFQQLHQRRFAELGVDPTPKKKIETPVSDYSDKKPPVERKPLEPKEKVFKSPKIVQQEEEEEEKKEPSKRSKPEKREQIISRYGEDSSRAAEDIKEAIIEAISSIKNIPVQVDNSKQKPVVIQQRVSEYGSEPPTPLSKAITFLLIFLLILLLGLLGAVFFFKEELIELFNNLSIR